jgi:beta-glucanase (GH16 family)
MWKAAKLISVLTLLVVSVACTPGVSNEAGPPKGANVQTCGNPVLANGLDGWGSLRGADPVRRQVDNHVVADYAYVQEDNKVADPSFYLPQQRVRGNETWRFSYDAATSAAGRARIAVDWYSTPDGNNSGWLGRGYGAWIDLPGGSGWYTVGATLLVPAQAIRATVLTEHEYSRIDSTIAGTACSYQLVEGDRSQPGESIAGAQPPISDAFVTAAENFAWGNPTTASDEFDYEGRPDPSRWILPDGCWDGNAGKGRRCQGNVTVHDGVLRLYGDANGDTGWIRQRLDTRYGRWEIRSRSRNLAADGGLYHPIHLIWPSSERWPDDGEYDFLEYSDPDARCATAFIHYPHPSGPVQQERAEKCDVDMTQWHNFGMEWTPDYVAGFVDGVEWFKFSGGAGVDGRSNIQDMPSGALTIQLDNYTGSNGNREAEFLVDWVRFYPLPSR